MLLTTKIVIERAIKVHANKYDYKNTVFLNSKSKLRINCTKENHGDFYQRADAHIGNKQGCKKCATEETALKRSYTKDEFIKVAKSIHQDKYDYSNSIYIKNYDKLKIFCNACNANFWQTPSNHCSNKYGCPYCAIGNISKIELKYFDYIGLSKQFLHKTLKINDKNYKVDAYVPEKNLVYEFQGDYWHGNMHAYKFKNDKFNFEKIHPDAKIQYGELYYRTLDKQKIIEDAGYNLIVIWEDEFNKIIKSDKLYSKWKQEWFAIDALNRCRI